MERRDADVPTEEFPSNQNAEEYAPAPDGGSGPRLEPGGGGGPACTIEDRPPPKRSRLEGGVATAATAAVADGRSSGVGGTCKLLPTSPCESDASNASLDSLPSPVFEKIVSRLPLRTVWALWQVSRALRSAIKRCQWQHKVVLYPSPEGNLTADFDGIAATRMFTLGGISLVQVEMSPTLRGRGAAGRVPASSPQAGPTLDLSSLAGGVRSLDMLRLGSWNAVHVARPVRVADVQRWVPIPKLTNLEEIACDAAWLSVGDLCSLSHLRELTLVGESAGSLLRNSASALEKLTSLRVIDAGRLNLGATAVHPAWRSLEVLEVVSCESLVAPWEGFVRLREASMRLREVDLWRLAAAPALEQLVLDAELIRPPPRERRSDPLRTLTSLEVLCGNLALPLHMFPSLRDLTLDLNEVESPSFSGSVRSMPHLTSFWLYNQTAGPLMRAPLGDFRSLRHLGEVHAPLDLFPSPRDFSGLSFATKVELWNVGRAVFGLDLSGLASVRELGLYRAHSLALRSESLDALTNLRALTVETKGGDLARHPVRVRRGSSAGEAGRDGGGAGGNGSGRGGDGDGDGGGEGSGTGSGGGATGSLDANGNAVHELAWVAGAAMLESLTLDTVADGADDDDDDEEEEEEEEEGEEGDGVRRFDADSHTFVSYTVLRWTPGKVMPRLTQLHLSGFHSFGFRSSDTTSLLPQLESLSLDAMEWEEVADVPDGALPRLHSVSIVYNPRLRVVGASWLCLPSLTRMKLWGNAVLDRLPELTSAQRSGLSPRELVVEQSSELAENMGSFMAVPNLKVVLL